MNRYQHWVLVAAPILLSIAPARAGMVITLQSVAAGLGTTGNSIEVTLQNIGAPVTIGAFNFTVTTSNTDITFTGADSNNTSASYIFLGDSFDVINGFPVNTLSAGQTMDGVDLSNSGAGMLIGTGVTLGLGRILFDVSPTAFPGGVAVTLLTDTAHTSLADLNANNIAIDTFNNGQIQVAAVPEPATALLLIAALAVGFLAKRRLSLLQPAQVAEKLTA